MSCNGEESHEKLVVFLQCIRLTHSCYDCQYPWHIAIVPTQNYHIVTEKREHECVREREGTVEINQISKTIYVL